LVVNVVFIVMVLIQVALVFELGQKLLLVWMPPSIVRLRHFPILTRLKKSRSDFRPEFCKALKKLAVVIKLYDTLNTVWQTTLDAPVDHIENRVRVCNLNLLEKTFVWPNLRHEVHEVNGSL